MTDLSDQWYWERRTETALRPVERDGDTVRLETVWHAEEIEDAIASGVLAPIEEIGLDRTDTTFDLIDSFRLPESDEDDG
jgi:hypothetical protein